jgi:hypothetical protein
VLTAFVGQSNGDGVHSNVEALRFPIRLALRWNDGIATRDSREIQNRN